MTDLRKTPGPAPEQGGFGLANLATFFIQIAVSEKVFLGVLGLCFLLSGMFFDVPSVARWLGFVFAAYAAIGNDSIQTIGTFITSNRDKKWYWLWLFIGGIAVLTMGYSWWRYSGDVSFERLRSKGFADAPANFSFLQVAAPLFLLVLTRMKMPVSTTFLLLTSFASTFDSVVGMIHKSLSGYLLAFGLSFVIWIAFTKMMDRWFQTPAHSAWRVFQWLTSGLLWSIWLMQDASNIAVYLPRSLGVGEIIAFLSVLFFGLGLLFFLGGEKIQEVVDSKSRVVDVRAATLIDLVYAAILFYFKVHSKVPMSTTWVFIGLLGGRELAMALRHTADRTWRDAVKLIGVEVFYVSLGLVLSLLIAVSVNHGFRDALLGNLGL